ncbi:hypothetical protein JL720_14917 [Aureococcus anophagefferens]|nr:hypothetical protein JL720_14917 [Aureococcus anophagefferens]
MAALSGNPLIGDDGRLGAARCQATGRELEDDDEAVTVVPGDAEEAPAPTTLVLLMASHIASADRLCALGDALRAASAAQTAAPDGILLSWSAEEAWREHARRLVKECDCDAVECAGRRSQFEHLAALGALVAHRWGKKRSVWCFFGDDDDSRTAADRGVPRGAGEPYEYFHYAVRVPALLSFLGAAPPALKAARFCDVAFVEFLRRTDRRLLAAERRWGLSPPQHQATTNSSPVMYVPMYVPMYVHVLDPSVQDSVWLQEEYDGKGDTSE